MGISEHSVAMENSDLLSLFELLKWGRMGYTLYNLGNHKI